MSIQTGVPVRPSSAWRDVNRTLRRFRREMTRIGWQLTHERMSDRERFGLRLAHMHLLEGRRDLAEEDLMWLMKHVEDRPHHGPIQKVLHALKEVAAKDPVAYRRMLTEARVKAGRS